MKDHFPPKPFLVALGLLGMLVWGILADDVWHKFQLSIASQGLSEQTYFLFTLALFMTFMFAGCVGSLYALLVIKG